MKTYLPNDLKELHVYLKNVTGLPANSLGVLPDSAHLGSGGYHCGKGDLISVYGSDLKKSNGQYEYSVRQYRDRVAVTNAASAIDVGNFKLKNGVTQLTLAKAIINAHGKDARVSCVRQVIYGENGVVKQFDAASEQHGGDSSHLGHVHISFWRDSEGKRNGFLEFVKEVLEGKKGSGMATIDGIDPYDGKTPQAAELRNTYFLLTGGYNPAEANDNGVIARLERIEKEVKELKAPTGPTAADVAAEIIKQLSNK